MVPRPQGSLSQHGDRVRPCGIQTWVLAKARQKFLEMGPILPAAVGWAPNRVEVGGLGHTALPPQSHIDTK